MTAGITQEIAPRVSLQVDYVRRSWGNLPAIVNDALTAADFDTFVYNVPSDPRLPGGGGYPLTFRDVKPAMVQQIRNRLTFANEVGGAYNRFNGVDVTVNARLRAVTIQGGTSTGNVVEDSCGVVTQNPEYYIFSRGAARASSSTRSSVASGSGRSSSAIASLDGRRTSRGWRRTRCRRSTC